MNSELFRVDGDVAVVTGAGRGIGEGIAKTLASAGAAVVCAARRTNEIERVAKEIRDAGGEAVAVTTDVTKKEDVDDMMCSSLCFFTSCSSGDEKLFRMGVRCNNSTP